MTRNAPDSGFFMLTSEHKRNIQRVETYPFKKSLLLEVKGKAKGCPSMTEKLHQAFRRLVLPDARRFWATFPRHCFEEGVYQKDFSSNCARGMSNPVTHIT
jgi:hypothetical protein